MQKRWRRDWLESPEACAENHNSLGVNNIDPNVYVYTADALSMAGKLYWRYKKDGKWTWRAALDVGKDDAGFICVVDDVQETGEEE